MLENKYTVLLNFPSKFGTSFLSQQWEWFLLRIQTGTLFSTIQFLPMHDAIQSTDCPQILLIPNFQPFKKIIPANKIMKKLF